MSLASRSRPLVALVLLGLGASSANAQGPTEPAEFSPSYEELLLGFEDAAFDTGWIPGGSPVQMRFFVDAANSITIDLPGEAYYDWATEELRFEGDELGGWFEYDVGLEIEASVKVDASGIQWQSDILGPYDWGVEVGTAFTPYLLPGNPDRPAQVSDKSGALDLVSIPLTPDLLVIKGTLDIALFVDIEASLRCNRIEVLGPDGQLAVFANEGESLWLDPGDGPEDLVLAATAYCQLVTEPTLIIYPHLVMTVLFTDYDIAGIEIPVALPVVDDEIAFDTIGLIFPRWDAEPDPGDTGGESGDGGDEVGDEGETGEELGGEGFDDGCACTSSSEARGGPLGVGGLALLVLLGLRRRRTSATSSGVRGP